MSVRTRSLTVLPAAALVLAVLLSGCNDPVEPASTPSPEMSEDEMMTDEEDAMTEDEGMTEEEGAMTEDEGMTEEPMTEEPMTEETMTEDSAG